MAGNLLQKVRQSFHYTFVQLTLIRIITNHSQDTVRKHYKAVNLQTQNAQIHMSVCALPGSSGVRKAALLHLHGTQWLSTRTWEITLMT